MSRCVTSPSPPNLFPLKFSAASSANLFGFAFRFGSDRKDRLKRRLKFVFAAELSKPFSLSFGLDSQASQPHDPSQSRRLGPVPGDIAEIEAYCRIFRTAERLHSALMETLCNPVTGVCSVYYDFPSEEKPLLEDKIVAVIGCMVSLLNKGREDVLSGRSSVMSSFGAVDELPPLAVFRSEMKRCCESLHVALEDWMVPGEEQSLDVWRKLQRLKNVCYDSGFPRKEDEFPCNTLFANWDAVHLSTSEEDSEVAFWRGGQVTEEGLEWLMEKGFKTIVDLRAETVKDNIYQAAVDEAIASGEVELIRIPVEVGTAPSREQVEKFARLVSDSSKKPLYLHSKEGLLRASAMVSRWRQHLARRAVQSVSKQSVSVNGDVEKAASMEKSALMEKKNESLEIIHGSNGALQQKDEGNLNGSSNDLISVQGMTSVESEKTGLKFSREVDPLNAQVPPCNVFSRKEMAGFLAKKSVTPLTYFNYQLNRLKVLPISRYMNTKIMWRGEIVGSDLVREVVEAENSNWIPDEKYLLPKFQTSGNGEYLTNSGNGFVAAVVNGFGEEEKSFLLASDLSTNVSSNSSESVLSNPVKEDRKSNGRAPSVSSDDELGSIEGDMCASATGVVRVQSRKKAEMFLVRTDGFSCTREKVTESSLAFTHPSTQQQMLMWKSTPKTVLVLKKLGQELMEQAKEVVSFLYYQEKMNVLVEPDVHDVFARIPGFGFVQTFYTQDTG